MAFRNGKASCKLCDTGSTPPTPGDLAAKAGVIFPGGFSGNPKKAAVIFTTPYPNTNYSITSTVDTANDKQFLATYENKTANGFTINLGANNIANVVEVSWHTLPNGEV